MQMNAERVLCGEEEAYSDSNRIFSALMFNTAADVEALTQQ